MKPNTIPALLPRTPNGHQFVIYADSCSGQPDHQHERNLAAINTVIQRLDPQPEFICFPGDEIIGLTNDESELRQQWDYWLNHEMAWLDRDAIPMYHTTGNHTTYNPMSERVFADVLDFLPRNGPADQQGLSYYVRRDNLLMIFVHTLWSGLGGEGNMETHWLEKILLEHADAQYKLVFGHHPVFPVNGYSGVYQRQINAETSRRFWALMEGYHVLAYICSHILAFDVQVHSDVLQICTAGAGTHHRMPEGIEYLHSIQATVDDDGLRYQVLDEEGTVREWLEWPIALPHSDTWQPFSSDFRVPEDEQFFLALKIEGTRTWLEDYTPQTLLSTWHDSSALSPLWIGIATEEYEIVVSLSPAKGRSPHMWIGTRIFHGKRFSVQIGLHTGMGPGGILQRHSDDREWSTMTNASAWGLERLTWPQNWSIGYDQMPDNQPFRGTDLSIVYHLERLALPSNH